MYILYALEISKFQITHILEDFTRKMDTSTPQNKRFLMISSDELAFFREVQGGDIASFFQAAWGRWWLPNGMVEWISLYIWIFIDILICGIHIKLQGMATLMQLTGSRADQLILWTGRCCFDHFSSTWGILAESCCTFHSQHWKEDMACYISQMIFVHDFGEHQRATHLSQTKKQVLHHHYIYHIIYHL